MCGICGILDFSGTVVDRATISCMADAIRHRGPDDQGIHVEGPVGLGQRRLSIIDLSPLGHQPMHSPDGRYTTVYNGEIYNFPELRARLEGEGVSFRGRSDTEVMLHAYMRWGESAFPMFNGMFAMAIWDRVEQQLTLVRDRFGIKPLYYHRLPDGIVFGSEIKALLASGRVPRRPSHAGLHEYLYYGNALTPNTLYEGIQKLVPGSAATISKAGFQQRPYFRFEETHRVNDDLATATSRVRELVEASVRRHLISDVPVGIFLSGGVDSSTVTALASRHYQGRIKTYSVGFDFDRGVNELQKARRVADFFGTDHQELHIAGGDMPAMFEKMVRCHDEPFGDAADIPLYLLCEQLKGSVKVILQGDGGDELFAGYRRYNVLAHERFWRTASWLAPLLALLAPRSPRYFRGMRFLRAMSQRDAAMRMALLMTQETLEDPPTLVLSGAVRESVQKTDAFAAYREACDRFSSMDAVQRMLYADCALLLPDQFLEKVDKPTMASSIEVRVPLLDSELAAYVMGLPSSMKVRRVQKKFILRQAMRGIVPDDILDGPKTGFGVPYDWWLKEPLADYLRGVLLDPAARRWGFFDEAVLETKLAEHTSGRRNNGFLLYKLLQLALWHAAYLN